MRNLAFTHCKRIHILQFFYGLLIMYTISSWTNSYQMSQVHSWRYVETLVIKSYIFPERKKQPPKEYPSNDLKLICERSFPVFPISERNRKWLVFPISIISFICPEKKILKTKENIPTCTKFIYLILQTTYGRHHYIKEAPWLYRSYATRKIFFTSALL